MKTNKNPQKSHDHAPPPATEPSNHEEVPINPNAPVLLLARGIATLVAISSLALLFCLIVIFKSMITSLADTIGLSILTSIGIIAIVSIGWITGGGNSKTVLGALDM